MIFSHTHSQFEMWKLVFIFSVVLCSQCSCLDAAEDVKIASPVGFPDAMKSRIVGGTPADIRSYPFAAQLISSERVVCGGTLLTARHILTAAHCVVNDNNIVVNPRIISVRVGTSLANSGGTQRSVSAIIKHENYDIRRSHDHDVAILLLSRNVTLGGAVAAAAIPPVGYALPANASVTVVGWGTMSSGAPAGTLQQVTVTAVNHTTCAQRYATQQQIVNERMICAGVLDIGGRDSCQGDSGGPLIYQNVVVGITSWGIDCGSPIYPGVYVNVSSYTNWIQDTVRRSSAASVNIGIISLLIPVIISLIKNQ